MEKGKSIYFKKNELIALSAAIKLFDEYADDETLKFVLDFGLESAWEKIVDKILEYGADGKKVIKRFISED